MNQEEKIINDFKHYEGTIIIAGKKYTGIQAALPHIDLSKPFNIKLMPQKEKSFAAKPVQTLTKITVKKYMTQPATATFDFQRRWNNNVPMPFITMVGKKLQETNGMIKMQLYGYDDLNNKIMNNIIWTGWIIKSAIIEQSSFIQ